MILKSCFPGRGKSPPYLRGGRSRYDFKRLFTISEYYDRDRAAYYRTIQSVRERGMDLTGWLEHFTEGLAVQMRICYVCESPKCTPPKGEYPFMQSFTIMSHNLL